jgi:tetratricopeptide (TPR) repeat protein
LNEGNDHPERLALWVRALLLGGRFDQAVSIVEPLFGDEAWRQRWLALARVVDISTAAEALNVIEPSMLSEGADLLRLAVAFDALAVRCERAEYFDHADALALRAAGDPKHTVDALLIRGRIAEGRSDWATAEQLYRRIITDQPDNAAALNNLAFVIAQSPARLSEALAYIERAVALRPQQPDILDTYATVLHALGRLYEAHEALTQALAHRPADVAIRLNLVETVLAQGRLDDAWRMLQQIERTLSRRPQPDPRHLRRAEALRRRLDDAQTAAVVSDPQ